MYNVINQSNTSSWYIDINRIYIQSTETIIYKNNAVKWNRKIPTYKPLLSWPTKKSIRTFPFFISVYVTNYKMPCLWLDYKCVCVYIKISISNLKWDCPNHKIKFMRTTLHTKLYKTLGPGFLRRQMETSEDSKLKPVLLNCIIVYDFFMCRSWK